MTASHDDDDKERLSWREIDALRDRSRHTSPEPRAKGPKAQKEKDRQKALKNAAALFSGKSGLPDYRKALNTLENSHGTPKFATTAKKFLATYGLPEEWGALILLLDYPDPAVTQDILHRLAEMLPQRTRVEQQGLKGKLRAIALTATSPEVKAIANQMLAAF